MNGQTTTKWVKPAKVTEPMTVVLESATAQKYEANWQGHTSTRYRIKCKNDIMLDTTGMFVKMMIDSGAKDGDTMILTADRITISALNQMVWVV